MTTAHIINEQDSMNNNHNQIDFSKECENISVKSHSSNIALPPQIKKQPFVPSNTLRGKMLEKSESNIYLNSSITPQSK